MLHKGRKSVIAVVGAASLLGTMAISGIVGASTAGATSGRAALAGTAEASAARQHPVGAVAASSAVSFDLVLQLRDAAGAQALVRDVSTPGSANFRHYLSASDWEARFSPTASNVNAATAWLRSQGFKVGAVSKDRITVAASGSAAQVERAFGTSLENYQFRGHTVRYATGNLSVPASLAGVVVGAMGINQNVNTPAITKGAATTAAPTTATTNSGSPFPPAPAAFITSPPCGTYYGQKNTTEKPAFGHGYPTTVPDQVCGYQPAQFRSAYGLTNKNTGAGVTVAIVDAYGSATIAQDATKFYNTYDPSIPFSNAHFQQADAFPFDDEALCQASGWATEQDLDVEAVHSMAPRANILYVGAQDCVNGLFGADQAVIDQGAANIVTNSWGDTGGDLLDDSSTRQAFDDEFMLADSTGITVNFSTGDDGDNFDVLGVSAADYPASSPFVTSVGGTTMQVGSSGARTGDLGWATGRSFLCTSNVVNVFPGCTSKTVNTWGPVLYDGGSGGYTSYNYTQPFYQAGVVPVSLATRNSPIIGEVETRVIPEHLDGRRRGHRAAHGPARDLPERAGEVRAHSFSVARAWRHRCSRVSWPTSTRPRACPSASPILTCTDWSRSQARSKTSAPAASRRSTAPTSRPRTRGSRASPNRSGRSPSRASSVTATEPATARCAQQHALDRERLRQHDGPGLDRLQVPHRSRRLNHDKTRHDARALRRPSGRGVAHADMD